MISSYLRCWSPFIETVFEFILGSWKGYVPYSSLKHRNFGFDVWCGDFRCTGSTD
jgi:hypothetical protein